MLFTFGSRSDNLLLARSGEYFFGESLPALQTLSGVLDSGRIDFEVAGGFNFDFKDNLDFDEGGCNSLPVVLLSKADDSSLDSSTPIISRGFGSFLTQAGSIAVAILLSVISPAQVWFKLHQETKMLLRRNNISSLSVI